MLSGVLRGAKINKPSRKDVYQHILDRLKLCPFLQTAQKGMDVVAI